VDWTCTGLRRNKANSSIADCGFRKTCGPPAGLAGRAVQTNPIPTIMPIRRSAFPGSIVQNKPDSRLCRAGRDPRGVGRAGEYAEQSQFAAGRTPYHSIVPSFQYSKPTPIVRQRLVARCRSGNEPNWARPRQGRVSDGERCKTKPIPSAGRDSQVLGGKQSQLPEAGHRGGVQGSSRSDGCGIRHRRAAALRAPYAGHACLRNDDRNRLYGRRGTGYSWDQTCLWGVNCERTIEGVHNSPGGAGRPFRRVQRDQ
jgi:hypothetical protein